MKIQFNFEAIFSFIAGAILAGGLILLQTKLQDSKELKVLPIKLQIEYAPQKKDTISNTCNKDSVKTIIKNPIH